MLFFLNNVLLWAKVPWWKLWLIYVKVKQNKRKTKRGFKEQSVSMYNSSPSYLSLYISSYPFAHWILSKKTMLSWLRKKKTHTRRSTRCEARVHRTASKSQTQLPIKRKSKAVFQRSFIDFYLTERLKKKKRDERKQNIEKVEDFIELQKKKKKQNQKHWIR